MPNSARSAQADVLRTFARVGHALGHPARLGILTLLAQAPKTVSALADACDQSVANTSAHLSVLAGAGLVVSARDGRHVRYALAHDAVSAAVSAVREAGEAVAPAEHRPRLAAFHGDDVAALTPRALHRVLRGRIALLDVRPDDEYAAGHLPGALSIPVDALRRDVAVPGTGPVLIYCRGRYCTAAIEGVRLLARHRREVKRLPFGVAEWKAAGYRLERVPQ